MSNSLKDRLPLHRKLVSIMAGYKSSGDKTDAVYYNPPANVSLTYPCIIYSRRNDTQQFADNIRYFRRASYEIKVLDKNPDSLIVDEILEKLPLAVRQTNFVSDNIYHFILNISNGGIFK